LSIVRELTTKLNFAFDKTNLDKFERSVSLFKTNIVTTTGDLVRAAGATLEFLNNLAQSSLRIKNIADFSGIAVENFQAMRLAAQDAGVEAGNFETFFQNLTKEIKLATVGEGKFFRLAQQIGTLRFPKFGEDVQNINNALEDVFNAIIKIENKSEQLRVLQNISGLDQEGTVQLLNLINQGYDTFVKTVEANKELASTINQETEAARAFNDQIIRLNSSFDKLFRNVASKLTPYVAGAFEGLNSVFAREEEFGGGLSGLFKSGFNAAGQGIDHLLGELIPGWESMTKLQERIANENIAFYNSLAPQTTINISVPEGTTEDQSSFMAEAVEQSIQEVLDRNTRQLISSNPAVE
jgi:hypothetical protein